MALSLSWPAGGQQTPATPPAATGPAAQPAVPAPAPAPSWAQARPQNAAAETLAPQVAPPLPAPVDRLPLAELKVPKNFRLEVYAGGLANARSIRIGDKGTVFVSTRTLDRVYAVVDRNGKREVRVLARGLNSPNGIALHDGTLYIAEINRISKIDNVEERLDNPPKPAVIYSDLPNVAPHGWKFLTVGPDNKLYFNIGAPCNICMPPPTHAQLRRINLDGSGAEVVARGIRQVVGMDFHPVLKQLYFTENQRDWMSENEPQDKLNRVLHPGQDNFGYPYCDGGDIADPIYGWGHSCDEFTKPIAQLGPHSAPLGMRFYTGHMFPREYDGAIFIARHGSWNKTKKIGGDIVVAKLNTDGTVRSVQPFITGFLQNNKYVGRPVDVEVMKDGSMLISDDWNGAVYRLTYGTTRVSSRR
ncbi:MAG: PQQ-dependent sugar dehydrogenase [Alphaproteobacteria bacterium]|nr:PQQ-dependent sugar dehydrogenase [Alphaproteobacteria bacterium]